MDNLIFSLNATLPIFALMLLGYFFRRIGMIDEKAAAWMNRFVFRVALPVLVFEDLAGQDFAGTWNGKFVLFCFCATSVSIAVIALLSKLFIKNKGKRGEFIQASYRSSAALLGIAFIHNIYGDSAGGMGPLMILGSVPLYNIFAVIVLMLTAEETAEAGSRLAGAGEGTAEAGSGPAGAGEGTAEAGSGPAGAGEETAEAGSRLAGAGEGTDGAGEGTDGAGEGTDGAGEGKGKVGRRLLGKTLLGIATNPIIIGILAGLIWSLLRIPRPKAFQTILSDIAALATPLGLMSMGATFTFRKAVKEIGPALAASFIKLFALVAVFMPVAVALGFAGEQIVAILVMLGSATTVSCYIMAKSMGHEGTLSSSVIMMTTFGCSFSLTFWLFLLRSLGVI